MDDGQRQNAPVILLHTVVRTLYILLIYFRVRFINSLIKYMFIYIHRNIQTEGNVITTQNPRQ
jgi:hypothetical protein